MCGIVGYAGKKQALPILLDGLSKLEYRGYDSAGICVQEKDSVRIVKAKGRLGVLRKKCEDAMIVGGTVGIGHTRWATHGEASEINSHPQLSSDGRIAVVHNGIIENQAHHRSALEQEGIRFVSQTDTEVIANLIAKCYAESGNFLFAVQETLAKLEGSYALGIMCADETGRVIGVMKESPLVFTFGKGGKFIASDVSAVAKYAEKAVYLEDGELVDFCENCVKFYDKNRNEIQKEAETITANDYPIGLDGYPHYMLKEIFEQPMAIRATIDPMIRNGRVDINGVSFQKDQLLRLRKISFVGCGSAYYVGMLAKCLIEKTCEITAEAVVASEFRYGTSVVDERCLIVLISQSGETSDTLSALREAKRKGAQTLAIVNVKDSSIAKLADQVLYTQAGTETAVATTKAFSAQLAAVYLMNLYLGDVLGTITSEMYSELLSELHILPDKIKEMLYSPLHERCKTLAKRFASKKDAYFIGRNLDCAICMEGSLKLKEVAYVHSEAYPAGEMKHGPIALIEKGTPVIAVCSLEELYRKTLSNMQEVKARGAEVTCIAPERLVNEVEKIADHVIVLPDVHPYLCPSMSVIPMQMLSYYTAINRGCEVDKPRNLAKSVTVE